MIQMIGIESERMWGGFLTHLQKMGGIAWRSGHEYCMTTWHAKK